MTQTIVVTTFYKFTPLPDFRSMQKPMLEFCMAQGVFGTILLAAEGINSTIAGTREGIDAVLSYLQKDERIGALTAKESFTDEMPFKRMKVRLKREIVALKVAGIDPNQQVGTYVEPENWNALISDPEVLVIDTRNDFETQIGTFQSAINPQTESFHEFPDFVRSNLDPQQYKKIAMFCTGGIRCEKATAYMLQQGFEEVYHLKGGILRYLEVMPQDDSLWSGECFVFDERVSVNHDLTPGEARFCDTCKTLLRPEDTACPTCQDDNP